MGVERAGFEQGVQVDAVDQAHGDVEAAVDFADVMDGHDVGVVEACCGAGFPAEPLVEVGVLGEVGEQHLQRHHAVDGGVVGAPHLAHTATTQQLNQLVAAKWRPFHGLTITAHSRVSGRDGRGAANPARGTVEVGRLRATSCGRFPIAAAC